jgi:hypothetical protein
MRHALALSMLAGASLMFAPGRAATVQPQPGPAAEQKEEELPPSFMGRVTAVSEKHLVLKPEVGLTLTTTHYTNGRPFRTTVYVQDNTKPPRTFVFSPTYQPLHGEHKHSEIQVGDLVYLRCIRKDGVDICFGVQIHRRPGGRVPPIIGDDKTDPSHRWDNRRNAEQWIEETLIPALRGAKIFPDR